MKDSLVTLRVNEELKAKIEEVAKITNISTSDFIRNCLEEAISNNEDTDLQYTLLKKKAAKIEKALSNNYSMFIEGNTTVELIYDSFEVSIKKWTNSYDAHLKPAIQITLLVGGQITLNTYIDNTQKIETRKVFNGLREVDREVLFIKNI